jgi:hypothetical protein
MRFPRLLIALVFTTVACGDRAANGTAALPWRTEADSTGDTIVVRTVGDVPDSLVHTVVPILRVGALDGAEEVTFGYLGDVMGLPEGGLLVHDAEAEIIRMFDSTGAFVRNLGGKGGGPGEYGQVNGIARHRSGDLYVWDATGGRVNRYRADGSYVTTWRAPFTGWFTQNQLFADDAGRLLMWLPISDDASNPLERRDTYVRLDSSGTAVDTLPVPTWPSQVEPLQASSPDGGARTMMTRPWTPAAVATVHPAGALVTGVGEPYVFFLVAPGRRTLRVEREYTPVPVSDTERREQQAQIEERMRRLDPAWTWTGAPIPATKPAYEDFLVGEDGRIWVRVSTPAEPIPAAEMPPPPTNPEERPPLRLSTREPEAYDVFTADGRLLGRVRVPTGMRLLRTRGNAAWGVMRDADEVEYAARFRIEPALPD